MTKHQALLKLDFDDAISAPNAYVIGGIIRRRLARAGYIVKDVLVNRSSPSGNGWHIVLEVTPRPKCPFEVVALETICGGDVNRQAMQMNRARAFLNAPAWMRDAWNVLYLPAKQRERHVQLSEF
jgi:hypothetical protein